MRRFYWAWLVIGLSVLGCTERVKLKVKIGVRDAGPTKTATTTAVP